MTSTPAGGLAAGLRLLAGLLRPASPLEAERLLRLEVRAGALVARARIAEGELALTLACDPPPDPAGPVAVAEVARLAAWAATFPAETPVALRLDPAHGRLELAAEGSRKVRACRPAPEEPPAEPTAGRDCRAEAGPLAAALRVARWPPAATGAQPGLEAVVLQTRGADPLHLWGAEHAAATHWRLPLLAGSLPTGTWLLPPRPLEALRAWLERADPAAPVALALGGHGLRARAGAATLLARRVVADGAPDWAPLFARPARARVRVARAPLLLALERVREERVGRAVSLRAAGETLRLASGTRSDGGDAVCPAAASGAFALWVDGARLRRLLLDLEGDTLLLAAVEPPPGVPTRTALHLRVEGAADREALLAPLHVAMSVDGA